jgi:hypothetical protein
LIEAFAQARLTSTDLIHKKRASIMCILALVRTIKPGNTYDARKYGRMKKLFIFLLSKFYLSIHPNKRIYIRPLSIFHPLSTNRLTRLAGVISIPAAIFAAVNKLLKRNLYVVKIENGEKISLSMIYFPKIKLPSRNLGLGKDCNIKNEECRTYPSP